VVAASTVAGGLAAWWLGLTELGVLSAACAVMLLVGYLTVLGRVRLRVRREIAPVRVGRGEAALGLVVLGNVGRRSVGPLLASDQCGQTSVALSVPALRPGTSHTASYFLPTSRRGETQVGPLRVTVTDPLGLFRRDLRYGETATLLVHPRVVPLETLPSGSAASLDGPTSPTAATGTVTFHALREYVHGDDLRHIHWRTSARTGTLMVRQLVDSSLPRTTVLLDNRRDRYADEDELELAVDIAASVLVAAVRAGFPVLLVTADGDLSTVDSGRGEVERLLRRLALVAASGPADLARTAAGLRPGPTGGSLTVVTGSAGSADELDPVLVAGGAFDRIGVVVAGTAVVGGDRRGVPVLPAPDLAAFAAAWPGPAAVRGSA
jgi:uncharacterized protein (DUF58 family)